MSELGHDFSGKIQERIITQARRHGVSDLAAALLTADAVGLSDKRLTVAQAKTLAVQLIHENKTDAATPKNPPA